MSFHVPRDESGVVRDVLDAIIGVLEIALAAIVVRHLWRVHKGSPWLAVLTAFFLVRGGDRLLAAFTARGEQALALVLDALLLLVLALLLVTMERVVRGLELAEDGARVREKEYARALADYRRLVRHRLATPLTAIFGSVRFLRELDPGEDALRDELLDTVERETTRLKSVCLEPDDQLRPEERELRPRPHLSEGSRVEGSENYGSALPERWRASESALPRCSTLAVEVSGCGREDGQEWP
jgi:signal transduction histidine kinase